MWLKYKGKLLYKRNRSTRYIVCWVVEFQIWWLKSNSVYDYHLIWYSFFSFVCFYFKYLTIFLITFNLEWETFIFVSIDVFKSKLVAIFKEIWSLSTNRAWALSSLSLRSITSFVTEMVQRNYYYTKGMNNAPWLRLK